MIPFPDKKYDIIYADPPWSYSDKGCNGNAAEHYPTVTVDEICKLPVNVAGGGIASDNCILFMWATYPMMKEALKVIEAWGFTYKSIAFQWVKQNRSGNGYFFGLGRWTRGNTEPCLLAVKGKPKRISASVGQLVFSPLRRHSQKPDEVRDRIVELMGDLPRIELFARETAPGGTHGGTKRRRRQNARKPMDSKQIAEAMRLKLPVRYNGITYQQITEYILWYDAAGTRRTSVSLLDKNSHSITRAPADRVELVAQEGGTADE